jgi:hypothetical protein
MKGGRIVMKTLPFFAAALLFSATMVHIPPPGAGEAAGVGPNRPEKIEAQGNSSKKGGIHRKWKLKYRETFDKPLPMEKAPWVRDPHGEESPWHVDHLDDDGAYFRVQGGEAFGDQLNSFDVLRKRVPFGKDGWLTAELAARDYDKDGRPDRPPSLTAVTVQPGGRAAKIDEPSYDGGIIIRSTHPLPPRYRIEYTLRSIDFGGMRNGEWEYNGRRNGYDLEGCKSNWPWKRSGDFAGPSSPCNPHFNDVRNANGYYFLAIVDYPDPAPHNNIFIHNHRKVGMDAYNTYASGAKDYAVCNPKTGELYSYTGPESSYNAINAIFFAGDRWREPSIGYNEFMFETACGSFYPPDSEHVIVSAAEIQPELMPKETYTFAIERDETGYTLEMSGNFRHAGPMTLRYHRGFIEDGRPIWHFNNRPEEYDGRFNTTLTFSGPYGRYSVEQWPEGSAYPDFFILGDPHLNYYEGSAVIDDIKLYVPKE